MYLALGNVNLNSREIGVGNKMARPIVFKLYILVAALILDELTKGCGDS